MTINKDNLTYEILELPDDPYGRSPLYILPEGMTSKTIDTNTPMDYTSMQKGFIGYGVSNNKWSPIMNRPYIDESEFIESNKCGAVFVNLKYVVYDAKKILGDKFIGKVILRFNTGALVFGKSIHKAFLRNTVIENGSFLLYPLEVFDTTLAYINSFICTREMADTICKIIDLDTYFVDDEFVESLIADILYNPSILMNIWYRPDIAKMMNESTKKKYSGYYITTTDFDSYMITKEQRDVLVESGGFTVMNLG